MLFYFGAKVTIYYIQILTFYFAQVSDMSRKVILIKTMVLDNTFYLFNSPSNYGNKITKNRDMYLGTHIEHSKMYSSTANRSFHVVPDLSCSERFVHVCWLLIPQHSSFTLPISPPPVYLS